MNEITEFPASEPRIEEVTAPREAYCWISPTGHYFPLLRCQHQEAAEELFERHYPGERAPLGLSDFGLEERGWMKLFGGGASGVYFAHPDDLATPQQIVTCQRIIDIYRAAGRYENARTLTDCLLGIMN